MRIDKLLRLTERTDRWINDKEAELLYNLAMNCKGQGVIVEVGSWKGESTIYLAKGSEAGKKVKVYAIDPHTGSPIHRKWYGEVWTFDEFKRNIKSAGVTDLVVPLVKTSEEAAKHFKEDVELVFVDGDHEYDSVKLDFDLWFPKLIEGGFIAFHDSVLTSGPQRVVEKCLYKSNRFRNIRVVGSITFAEKVYVNSLSDRIGNRYELLKRTVYRGGCSSNTKCDKSFC